MYKERRDSLSVRAIILQVLFVLLFIFLLIWLFPTKNSMKKYVEDTASEKETELEYDRLVSLYNQIFAKNMMQMRDAAIAYYTIERLPSEVDENRNMSLQEMYDLNLVLDLMDKDGNYCDSLDSYVEVTKHKDEYTMKVNLSCGAEEDHIIVYLDVDLDKQKPSNQTTPPESVCEYRKVSGGDFGSWGTWTAWGKTKVSANDNTQVETKVERVVTGYKDERVQVGTKTETYITGYTTSKVIVAYTTERYISGYTTNGKPVYSTRQVPVYDVRKTPTYGTRNVPVYETVKTPIHKNQTYYRSRTRSYIGGTNDSKWSTCNPVDQNLIDQGYYLIEQVK